MRSQKCASVQLDEVDWERRRVLVHGKGAKQRWVGIGERTAHALRDYVARFRGEQAGALFLGRHREGMADGHSFYVLLGRLAKRAGVEKANPHRFRYSFATWAIASGARELDVQLLLGHSSPQMTQHYARAYDSEQASRRTRPSAPWDSSLRREAPPMRLRTVAHARASATTCFPR